MDRFRDFPFLVCVVSLIALWLAAHTGVFIRNRFRAIEEEERQDLGTVEAAVLTLLGLIIAFSFSMAISRYDHRKQCEAEEANAIGTEYVRAGLLAEPNADKTRQLLKDWLTQRIAFYEQTNEKDLQQINLRTARLESELWSTVLAVAEVRPSPPVTLAVFGMNDVLNDKGYTEASWLNRIPTAAWYLMFSLAILCNLVICYSARRASPHVFLVLPLALGISFLLMADIDSPRGGVIRVLPVNLLNLDRSIQVVDTGR